LNKNITNYCHSAGTRTSYFKIGKEDVNISRIVVPGATPVTSFDDSKHIKKVSTAPKIRPHTAAVTRRRQVTVLVKARSHLSVDS